MPISHNTALLCLESSFEKACESYGNKMKLCVMFASERDKEYYFVVMESDEKIVVYGNSYFLYELEKNRTIEKFYEDLGKRKILRIGTTYKIHNGKTS